MYTIHEPLPLWVCMAPLSCRASAVQERATKGSHLARWACRTPHCYITRESRGRLDPLVSFGFLVRTHKQGGDENNNGRPLLSAVHVAASPALSGSCSSSTTTSPRFSTLSVYLGRPPCHNTQTCRRVSAGHTLTTTSELSHPSPPLPLCSHILDSQRRP